MWTEIEGLILLFWRALIVAWRVVRWKRERGGRVVICEGGKVGKVFIELGEWWGGKVEGFWFYWRQGDAEWGKWGRMDSVKTASSFGVGVGKGGDRVRDKRWGYLQEGGQWSKFLTVDCSAWGYFKLHLITVLRLIFDSYTSWSTRFVSLIQCVGYSIFNFVLFLLKFIFLFNKMHGVFGL